MIGAIMYMGERHTIDILEAIMQAADIMTFRPASIHSNTAIEEAARLMLDYRISGLPVVDEKGGLVGIVTEGDLLRSAKAEAGRRTVGDVMTRQVISVVETTPISEVVEILERRNIKRVPVVKDGKVVGVISRADLLRGLAQLAQIMPGASAEDRALRDRVVEALGNETSAGWKSVNVTVRNGAVELRGAIAQAAAREGLTAAARGVSGVKDVKDLLVVVAQGSGRA
jgi:CBS domain-containing protein